MLLESVKKKVEELRVQTEKAAPHSDPEKVKELLKLIQLNKKSSKGRREMQRRQRTPTHPEEESRFSTLMREALNAREISPVKN